MTLFSITETKHAFDSARDAIDAISAFEAATTADYEYRIETNGERWFAALNNLETHQRGYLEPFNPKAFSVFGYEGDSTDGPTTFAAYSPSLEAARGDVKAYRADRPEVRIWHIVDNATGATETLMTKTAR